MKNNADRQIIHCESAFDSYVDKNSLHATVTLYLYREKGSLQITGDYLSPAGVHTPVKSVAGIVYQRDGQDYHVRFTGNKVSLQGEDINNKFDYLLPFSVTSENVDYVYQFRQQNDESYLIRQNGIPLMLCNKIPHR
ncbi:hypothetical protein ACSI5N_03580 [Raoultella ornithinolytica]|uniref:hypothetical protein n=1 Tax=Raoultella ornithinolytica TaxID=54291 RepID=UPI0013EF6BA4|nr:hypothetical protein [Raoultella ornithinolytica]